MVDTIACTLSRNIVQVYEPHDDYQGRMGAVRLRRGDLDVCAIVVYMWPEPKNVAGRRRCSKLWAYLRGFVERLPARCVPILCGDFNGHVGSVARTAVDEVPESCEAIGPCRPELQNYNGGQLRQLLSSQHMRAENTFHDLGPTFYGGPPAFAQTRVDYICIPQSRALDVESCKVLYTKGDCLQSVAAPGRRDHSPVCLTFQVGLRYEGVPRSQRDTYSREMLAHDAITGCNRHMFTKNVEMACSSLRVLDVNDFRHELPSPDRIWSELSAALQTATAKQYPAPRRSEASRPRDTAAALERTHSLRHALASSRREDVDMGPAGEPSLQRLHVLFDSWRRMSEFWRARKLSDSLCKRDKKKWTDDKVTECNEAWRRRDIKHMWRVGRVLSGCKVGPKKRRLAQPKRFRPSCSEWAEYLANDGTDGGCSATVLDWSAEHRHVMDAQPIPVMHVLDACQLAQDDFEGIKRLATSIKLHKCSPPWSLPGEVWRQILRPWSYRKRPKSGVGCADEIPSLPLFARCLYRLMVSIRLYGCTPSIWHLSRTQKIDKRNSKSGCAALRLINSLDVFGKLYYKWLWSHVQTNIQRPYASGYIQGKSRLSAIVQQNALADKLRRAGRSFCRSFHDVANAFPSLSQESINQALLQGARRQDLSLLQQRQGRACMHIEASDGDLHVRPHSGNLQGDTYAGEQFLDVYHKCLDCWQSACLQSFGDGLVMADPISEGNVDVAMSSYADDVARTVLAPSPADMLQTISRSNVLLDQALSIVTLAQHVDKQEHLPFFAGEGTDANMRRVYTNHFLPGKVVRAARYLGPLLHFGGRFNAEVANRVQAADRSWAAMGKFWSHNRLAKKPLIELFTALVYNTLLSGLEACCLNKTQLQRLDRKVLSWGRKLMRGEACVKLVSADGTKEFHALPSSKVWQYLGLVPSSIELAIRRLRFWQSVARNVEAHSTVLATVFGTFNWGQARPIDESGRLTPESGPWAKALVDDVRLLEGHDDGYLLVRDMDERPLLLFTKLREQFLQVDASVLKREFLSIAIPPPEWQVPATVQAHNLQDEEHQHRCVCTR